MCLALSLSPPQLVNPSTSLIPLWIWFHHVSIESMIIQFFLCIPLILCVSFNSHDNHKGSHSFIMHLFIIPSWSSTSLHMFIHHFILTIHIATTHLSIIVSYLFTYLLCILLNSSSLHSYPVTTCIAHHYFLHHFLLLFKPLSFSPTCQYDIFTSANLSYWSLFFFIYHCHHHYNMDHFASFWVYIILCDPFCLS